VDEAGGQHGGVVRHEDGEVEGDEGVSAQGLDIQHAILRGQTIHFHFPEKPPRVGVVDPHNVLFARPNYYILPVVEVVRPGVVVQRVLAGRVEVGVQPPVREGILPYLIIHRARQEIFVVGGENHHHIAVV